MLKAAILAQNYNSAIYIGFHKVFILKYKWLWLLHFGLNADEHFGHL